MGDIATLIKDFIDGTISQLVDSPDEVKSEVVISTKNIVVNIEVAKRDRGKVIGREGRTIEAMQRIALAIKNTQFSDDARNIRLEVIEGEDQKFSYN